jgi:23S rRNA pseudouridine1911/1915/1917 synthase
MPEKKTIMIPSCLKSERIDKVLAGAFPELSRSQIQRLIENGSAFYSGRPVMKSSHKITGGSELTLIVPEPVPLDIVPEPIPLEILYQDDDIAVINKPAGLMVHPAGRIMTGTLVNALLYHLNNLSGINGILRPGIVHRLDKDTTGVMIVAKNDTAHRQLAAQFENRAIEKIYKALVWGHFETSRGVISKPIARSASNRKKMVSGTRGKPSETHYKVCESFPYLTFLEIYPKTGRTHQIRSHFASIGCPVFGDAMYRGTARRAAHLTAQERTEAHQLLKTIHRQALHAAEITFTHPRTNERSRFSAPLPEDLELLLELMRKAKK